MPTAICCGDDAPRHGRTTKLAGIVRAAPGSSRRLADRDLVAGVGVPYLLLEELTDATLDGTRTKIFAALSTVPLLIIVDRGTSKLPPTAVKDLLQVIMRRHQRASTSFTCNRPVDD